MDKVKIKIIFRELFLFFAAPAAMLIFVVSFIFISFILDALIRYFLGNYGASGWITNLTFIMDRASFYPYLFAYPIFVLLRIEYRSKRKPISVETGSLEVEQHIEDPKKVSKRKRAIIRESVLFLMFIFLGLLPFLGIYNIFGTSLSMSINLGMYGFLVIIVYILYIIVRYIIVGVFIKGIIWCVRKLTKKP